MTLQAGENGQMGKGGLIALISLVSAVPPIATDLFLPAVPDMPAYFGTSEAIVNFILLGFFFFLAVGMLVFGPLSDKYGRRPILLISVLLFTIPAFLCALSSNVWFLVVERVVQGMGGGGMIAMGTALVKDCFVGKTRQSVLVATMAIGTVAPVAAPVIGAVILLFTTWQGTFIAQGIFGLVALFLALRFKESLMPDERIEENLGYTFSRLAVVCKNPVFDILVVVAALNAGAFMIYISTVSYVYVDLFGLSRLVYSLFFAVNAGVGVVGALLVNKVQKHFSPKHSVGVALTLGVISGVLVIAIGPLSPYAFFAAFAIFTLIINFVRPVVVAIVLEQQEKDTGSASSVINMSFSVFGSIFMLLVGIPWPSYIFAIGACAVAASAISLALFLGLLRSSLKVKGLD